MSYFPNAALPIRAFIAPGFDPSSPSSWTWAEITDDVRYRTGISIEVGRRDEASSADPGKCTLTLDNRSGDYSTRNALGAYYGDLRRNTPLEVRVDRGQETFTRSGSGGWGTSDSGFAWSHTSSAASFTVSGTQGVCTFAAANTSSYAILGQAGAIDQDVEFVTSIAATTTGANWVAAAVLRYTDTSNLYRLHAEFDTGGTIKVKIAKAVAGVNTDLVAITATGVAYSANTKIRVRARAVGQILGIKVWLDGNTEPDDWNATTEDTDLTGAGVGILNWRVVGNTNVGSLACSYDSFTASAVLFTGFVSEWPVRWDKRGNDSTVTITANGVLRRLQAGATPLRSPLYRQLSAQDPAGYWPCEDGSDATEIGSAVSGGHTATVSGVTFAAAEDLPGSETSVQVTASTSAITGNVVGNANTVDGYSGLVHAKLGSIPGAATNIIEWTATGTVLRWVLDSDGAAFGITGYGAFGAVVVARTTVAWTTITPTNWFAMQLTTTESGGNVNWSLKWASPGDTVFSTMSGSYAGTAEKITQFKIRTPVANTCYAHIWAGENSLGVDSAGAMYGFIGEVAATRIERLCDEEHISIMVEDADDSEAMGAQRTETVVALLQDVEDADGGILYEVAGGLAYRPRRARYNAAVNIALDNDSQHLAEAPEPTDDDQRIRNDVTVKRDSGGQARYIDADSTAAVGTYAEQATINISTDARLADHASWRVYLGTLPDLRWPRLEVNFGRHPTLIDDFLAVRTGYRITVANPPDQLAGEEVDLVVEGWRMELAPDLWRISMACSPAVAYQVGILGTTAVDMDGSTLNADITSSATSFAVASTAALWDTSGADFDVMIGGERMTCTAVSGASSPQTFTVTRAVNGVVKAHDAGTAVHVYRPLVAAL